MPLRPFSREQDWLLPPSLDESIPRDHPVRFVAAFVEAMDRAAWADLGIDLEGEVLGAPAYHPVALLCVWVYGFMTGVRSSRKLELACRDRLAYLWLTGWQHPDHNTLWRFYQANRQGMKKLFKRTVRTAVGMGLVDLALQAIDGSKIAGNATKVRSFDAKALARLLERTEKAIAELEAQNKAGVESGAARLPAQLAKAEALREQVRSAMEEVVKGQEEVNLTDREARLMKGRQGVVAGYNAQAVVSPLDEQVTGGTGLLITAVEVVNDPDDHAQAVPMLKEAEATTGQKAEASLLDGGYHSGENLEACEKEGFRVLMPEAQTKALERPYHKDHFEYDADSDSYSCPQGQKLGFSGIKRRKGRPEMRVYRASAAVCIGCPVFGQCTKDKHQGRALEIGPHEEELRRHRAVMATPEAKATYSRRMELVEPAFGILKEEQGARRFLLRGLERVRAEWALLAAAFNLKTLFRVWQRGLLAERSLRLEATVS
jgi:transposase